MIKAQKEDKGEHRWALLNLKCPYCHKGNLFRYPALSFKFSIMNPECSVCSQDFEIEPGFYYGSMYISYLLTVLVELLVGFAVYFFGNDPDTWIYIAAITITLVIISPYMFRYSRAIMLYWFGIPGPRRVA